MAPSSTRATPRLPVPTRRALKGALRGFLGTYVSRYSSFDGYWLFGFLVDQCLPMQVDLLPAVRDHGGRGLEATPVSPPASTSPEQAARSLAVTKFHEQLAKAGLRPSTVASARLRLERLAPTSELLDGAVRQGFFVRFEVTAKADTGRLFVADEVVFVAPHDPHMERQAASRGTP